MSRLFATLVCSAGLAACSAGQAPGGTGHQENTGGSAATGGTGGGGATGGTKGGSSGASGSGGNVGGASGNAGSGTGGASGASGSAGDGGTSGQVGGVACTTPMLGSPTLRLLTGREFESTINDIFPSIQGKWTDSLPTGLLNDYGFENDSGNVVGNQLASELVETSISIGAAVSGSPTLQNLLACASSGANRACAQTFLDQYGKRLFRRPLTAAEAGRYLALFDTGLAAADFPTAMKWVVAGLVQSPHAVYRSELGTDAGDGTRQLSGYELATELAYTFGGTTPSAELLDQLGSNPAADPVAIATELLAKDGGKEVVQHFFEAYLAYSGVASTIRTVPQGAPAFSEIGPAMVTEMREFIEDVVMTQGLGLRELLTANTTNPSKTLATFYGFPTPSADNARITRPAGQGLGILAQGAFLASHANSDASSPTLRGLFPYYRLLCQPKKTPPKNVPMINTAAETKTTRERYEVAHMKQGSGCAGCHLFFDPIGFGFEHFDQVGRYRTEQNGEPIDSVSNVPDPESGQPLFEFATQEELVTGLAELAETYDCFSAYMATYAYGSGDACLGASQVQGLQAGTVGILEAYAKLAVEPHFSRRNAQ